VSYRHLVRRTLSFILRLGVQPNGQGFPAVDDKDRERRRTIFDEVAELYDRVRPRYPREACADLVTLAGIGPGTRVLEIGCGTGQLSLPLAETGCALAAIDLGPRMAAIARRKLAPYPSAQVIVAAFEDWPLPDQPYDAVVSATAFHWIDPAIRVGKAARLLRPGGALATIATEHIAGGDSAFFVEVQACYERWDVGTQGGAGLPTAAEVPLDSEELDRSGWFEPAVFRRYEWQATYTAAGYCDLLLTYSGHRAIPPDARQRLLDCIAHLIGSRYGGKITKHYLTQLRLAQRLPDR
jgi:SAM-dependent methyltransferase